MSDQSLDEILKSLQAQIERLRRLTEREPLTKHDADGQQVPRTSQLRHCGQAGCPGHVYTPNCGIALPPSGPWTSSTVGTGSLTLESLKAAMQRLNTCGLCGKRISKTDTNIKLDLTTHRVFHTRCPAL